MRNPFTVPLRNTATAAEPGHPQDGYTFPATVELNSADHPDYSTFNTPLPYHGTTGERFQETNPGYAGEYKPHFLDEPGVLPTFAQLAPAPGSENLSAPRDSNSRAGTNRLFKPAGPVDGASASPGWTGKNAALRSPVVGNSGPVNGTAMDSGAMAAQAYFASIAARVSQAASDAAIVSAV